MLSFRVAACATALCFQAWGQNGTTPRKSPAEYPVHAKAGEIEIGAEYLVHSYSSQHRMFIVRNYLVVEVAVYPLKDKQSAVSAGFFRLRLNGGKIALMPQTPEVVAASLQDEAWAQRDQRGGVGVSSPRITAPADPDKPEPISAEEACTDSALPSGRFRGPVSGYLYFAYEGKTKKIKSAELLYSEGDSEAAIPLF